MKAYWKKHEERIRRYLRRYTGRPEVVDELLALVRRKLKQFKGPLLDQRPAYAIAHDLARPYAIPNRDTQVVIMAMEKTGNIGYRDSSPEVLADFLEGFHRDELDSPRPYHPVIRDVDMDSVDWMEVALCVAS
jgi:hypothetical protein